MEPMNKTLMTSTAALVIAASSAFAQDTTQDTATQDTSANAEAEAESDTAIGDVTEMLENTAEDVVDAADVASDTITSTANDMTGQTEGSGYGDGSDEAQASSETEAGADTEMAATSETTELDSDLAAAADMEIASLIGTRVVSQDGTEVGEIDSFVQHDGAVMAVVGMGGFFGIGERDVAVSLDQMTVSDADGQGAPSEFMLGHSQADLEAMDEFSTETATAIDSEMSLRNAVGT